MLPPGGSVGIAFDIPASTAKWVVAQLKEKGVVKRGWLGVKVQAVTKAIAESMGLKDAGGALVAEAEPQSPAAKVGLKSGDVITSINGEVVKDPRDLARRIAAISPDTTISIEYVRGGEAKTVHATVTPMQQIAGHGPGRHNSGRPQDGGNASTLGMTVAPAPEIEGAGGNGLAVLGVDPGGKAAELGFAPGDVIMKAGGQDVHDVVDFNRTAKAAAATGKSNVLVLVRRGDDQRYVAVPTSAG